MFSSIFLLAAVIQALFLSWEIRLLQRNRSIYSAIAAAVILGLVYDNFVIGIGRFLGEGNLLYQLNAARFFIHGLITPLMIMFAWGMGKKFDLGWDQKPVLFWGFVGLTGLMILMGVYSEIVTLNLVAELDGTVLRYVHAESSGPPIPSIIVIVVNIVIGAFLWRKKQWSVLCIGSILMFIFAAAGASMLVLSNIGEVIFSGSVVKTDDESEKRLER